MRNRGIFAMLAMLFFLACNDESSEVGDKYFKTGKYEEAIAAYNEYLELKPKHVKSLYNRGRAYEELGQFDQAMKDFKFVLKEDPNNVNALMSIGKDAFYRKSDFESSIYYFEKALKRDADNAVALTFKGKSHQRLGNLKEAMEDYNAAISVDKDYGDTYLSRGALRIFLKQRAKACADFRVAKGLGVKEADRVIAKYCK